MAVDGEPLNSAIFGANAGVGLFSETRTLPPVLCVNV